MVKTKGRSGGSYRSGDIEGGLNTRGLGVNFGLEPVCPKCGGEIKSRTTSEVISGSVKKTVPACENYPTCDWTKS